MEIRCAYCGAVLATPVPGAPPRCSYCGAPQPPPASPYGPSSPLQGPPAAPFGPAPSPPSPYGEMQPPGLGGPPPGALASLPRTNAARPVVILLALATMVAGVLAALVIPRVDASPAPASAPTTAATSGPVFPVASLATLSLAQTPDAMAKVTGVQAVAKVMGNVEMALAIGGSPFSRMQVTWSPTDLSHATEVYLWADVPPANDADIRARIASYVGARVDASGGLYFQGLYFSYQKTFARAAASTTNEVQQANPHWKQQVDASWDLVRNAVLGLSVPVTDSDLRDWLGRGYSLAAIGAVDVTVDVDHSTATMQAAFPGVATRQAIGLQHTLAVDHPWFGDAELDWHDAKNGGFADLYLRPPAGDGNNFPNQSDIEACVQSLVGGKGQQSEDDHLEGSHDTWWRPASGGSVRVYGHMVDIETSSVFAPKTMTRAAFQRLLDGMDACGRTK